MLLPMKGQYQCSYKYLLFTHGLCLKYSYGDEIIVSESVTIVPFCNFNVGWRCGSLEGGEQIV